MPILAQLKEVITSHKRLLKIAMTVRHPFTHNPQLHGIDYGIFIAEKLAEKLPMADYDCIIGIPRSGLLFANIIATKRGLPLSTPDCFTKGIVWQAANKDLPIVYKKVLLIDDSTSTAVQMESAYKVLKSYDPTLDICTASLFVAPVGAQKVDCYQVILKNGIHFYEWNIAHADLSTHALGGLCVDLDGVLCMNNLPDKPNIIPTFMLKAIITSRPESERTKTEDWLKEHGIKYEKLIMLNDSSLSSVDHKIKYLKELKPYWYWESHIIEAKQIALKARLPVLCFENMKIYYGK